MKPESLILLFLHCGLTIAREVCSKELNLLVDTGSTITRISSDDFGSVQKNKILEPAPYDVLLADGTSLSGRNQITSYFGHGLFFNHNDKKPFESSKLKCWNWGELGHTQYKCRKPAENNDSAHQKPTAQNTSQSN